MRQRCWSKSVRKRTHQRCGTQLQKRKPGGRGLLPQMYKRSPFSSAGLAARGRDRPECHVRPSLTASKHLGTERLRKNVWGVVSKYSRCLWSRNSNAVRFASIWLSRHVSSLSRHEHASALREAFEALVGVVDENPVLGLVDLVCNDKQRARRSNIVNSI